MKRSTVLQSQLVAETNTGTQLKFERSIGGYFSTHPEYTLQVMGQTTTEQLSGKNICPLNTIKHISSWTTSSELMTTTELESMLSPNITYTISFDVELENLPAESITCTSCSKDDGSYGCGSLSLSLYHSGLGFVLIHDTAMYQDDPNFPVGVPDSDTNPTIVLYKNYELKTVGEKYHGVVSFVVPNSLEGYRLFALTNQYQYSHGTHPELVFATVTFTNVMIEKGTNATTYEQYCGGVPTSIQHYVKSNSRIKIDNQILSVPCDLKEGDTWFPRIGVVNFSDGQSQKFESIAMKIPTGNVTISQEPIDVQANLKATILTKRAPFNKNLSWKDIQSIVRLGLAPQYFKVGDQLTSFRGGDKLTWDIIGIDHDTPANKTLKHSLTLQLHDVLNNTWIKFDHREALYYAENGLTAGTYHFALPPNYETALGGGKTYYFTITKDVPSGGLIMFPWGYNQQVTSVTLTTYSDGNSNSEIESVSVYEGTAGQPLGTAGALGRMNYEGFITFSTEPDNENMNYIEYARYGRNTWEDSDLRTFLNSNAVAGKVWSTENKSKFYQRPNTNVSGFLYLMDSDFLDVIGAVTKRTLNPRMYYGCEIVSEERIFIPAKSEVFNVGEGGWFEGSQYPYYMEQNNCIKYNSNGEPRIWWLRTPAYNSVFDVRVSNKSGTHEQVVSASTSLSVAPCCCII